MDGIHYYFLLNFIYIRMLNQSIDVNYLTQKDFQGLTFIFLENPQMIKPN